MTEKEIVDAGYRKYESGSCFPHSPYFYQKRFDNRTHKKYFINLVKYDSHKYPNGNSLPESFMAELTTNEPFMTFQIHHAEKYSLRKIESKIKLFYKTMGCKPYEKTGE